jgi:hypothetical protein
MFHSGLKYPFPSALTTPFSHSPIPQGSSFVTFAGGWLSLSPMSDGTRAAHGVICLGLMLAIGPGCASYSPPPSARAPKPTPGLASKPVVLPFIFRHGIIHVRARLNGSDPLWLALDSGAPCSLEQKRVEALKLHRRGKRTVWGIGGSERVWIYEGVTFDLAGAVFPISEILSHKDASGDWSAGVLGRELFDHFVVEISYQNRTVTLHEPTTFQYTGPGEVLQADYKASSGPVLETQITGTNQTPVKARLLVDTGCNGSLCLRHEFVEAHPELGPASPTREDQRTGAGGSQRIRIGRIGGVQLGRWTVDKPLANYFQGRTPGMGDLSGHFGNETLRRFNVILDASRQHLILETNAMFAQPFVLEVRGLVLGMEWPDCRLELPGAILIGESPNFKTFRVVEVVKNSPAAKAGIREEDIVLSLDGKAMAEVSMQGILQLFGPDGRIHLLQVQRGTERLELRLESKPSI